MDAGATTEQARWNHSRIVENDQFVASEEGRKFGEEVIFKLAGGTAQSEKTRGITAVERALGDLFAGKMVVKLVEKHRGSLAAIIVRRRTGVT